MNFFRYSPNTTVLLEESTEDLSRKFQSLQTVKDLADLLGTSYSCLVYYAVGSIGNKNRYKSFLVPKRSGGSRRITIPQKSLKTLQRKLSQVLYTQYNPRPCVHGYVVGKNVITNANSHRRKAFIFNLDIQDFFGSINLGRVRGLFMAKPFFFSNEVATTIANLCCHENKLPQGSPSSPIISNFICQQLDQELSYFAKKIDFTTQGILMTSLFLQST